MQTFLPFPDFAASARALDRQRLGKQRVEAWQIINALSRASGGWVNHPAVRMWRGYSNVLCTYGAAMCEEWLSRGYKDNMLARFAAAYVLSATPDPRPPWLGSPAFHESHRSMLIQKNPDYYRPLFPGTPDDLEYVWPVPPLTKEKTS